MKPTSAHSQTHYDHLRIRLADIKKATDNFSKDRHIGGGGFGEVYQGELINHSQGQTLAFKRLNRKHGQGTRELWNEIYMLSEYKHPNIVSLLGFYEDDKEGILVYEYASRSGLDLYLDKKELDWRQRLTISIGAASGLAYLHSGGADGTLQKIIHRDVKSSNILLDKEWNAKISDFGLSKFAPANKNISIIHTGAVGTLGYCDPLYVESGSLTKESDVYSFGVVLFEVLCGRLCIPSNQKQGEIRFIEWVKNAYEQQTLNDVICHHLLHEITLESMKVFTEIAYQCLNKDRKERPSMNKIVEALKKALDYQLSPNKAYDPETILSQGKINLPHMCNAVLALDSSIVDVDQLNNLLKVLPTSEERDMLKGYTGDKKMVGERGQFILECMKIPRIEAKLQLLKLRISFTNQINEITGNLKIIKEATKEIRESIKLASIMKEYDQILQRNQRGHFGGLWLNNIRKPKETEMFLLYKEGDEKNAAWFDFDKDLVNLDAASKIKIQDLRESKSTIAKEVKMAQQELNSSYSDGGVSPEFHEALKTFLYDAEQHPSLTYFFDSVDQDTKLLVEYFKGDPKDQSFTEVLGFMGVFIQLFKSQHDAVEKEKRERQKEAERIRREEEFAAEPITLKVFVLLTVAVVKTFDCFFKPL
ncbi:probable receptor-like protein kinase At2g23200 [Lactuca sativa]|uniref:probable receptor-like protein kinase At2g23200 n=1 Tax=Lactuca sativa TaxID=4236 RepID=UPI000CD9846C|nr:probable receptor-like protein kinase At2g23200 [Lactuca sativa]